MLVDGVIVADSEHISKSNDRSLEQLANAASLPGVVGEAWAMADFHQGFGFPIGGVLATDIENGGVISPGGVGFDINCGVRLCSIDLGLEDLEQLTMKRPGTGFKEFGNRLRTRVPAAESGKSGLLRSKKMDRDLSPSDLDEILAVGAKGANEMGFGHDEDLARMEMNGNLGGDPSSISDSAKESGLAAIGSIGTGNHFLEIQVVDEIMDEKAAKTFGLHKGRLAAMIHTGSRGLGYRVCSEHVERIRNRYKLNDGLWESKDWGISISDPGPLFTK